AQAIAFSETVQGVISDRCYGCGRCLPICPIEQITAQEYRASVESIMPLISAGQVDAIEIHTHPTHGHLFQALWAKIKHHASQLKVLAISCPDGNGHLDYLRELYRWIAPLPCPLIWQTDGRPMSGDIGNGTTRAAVRLGKKVLAAGLPGYVQLAGGTNGHTVVKLKASGLLNIKGKVGQNQSYVAGVAYGSYARRLLEPLPTHRLEAEPQTLRQSVRLAETLVHPLKAHSGELNVSTD
ncbi:MAG: LdpA C-terminal domain-containing domain, partial [Thermosynechococcaceae cyanobacterium]